MLALLAAAEAAMVTRTLCAIIDEDFDDEAPHADWMKYNGVRPLRGIRMYITQRDGPQIFDGFTSWNGSNPGCVTLQLDDQFLYDVDIAAWISVQGRKATATTNTSVIMERFRGYRPGGDQNFHHPYQKEYASTAATEGWAHFMAAWAFNSQTQSDCVLARPPGDWFDFDLNQTSDFLGPYLERSCEDEPWDIDSNGSRDPSFEAQVLPWVPAYAWLDAAITVPFPLNNCQGPLANRGVTSDWTRFWWDMYTDENLSLTKLIQVYDLMDPHTWDKNGFTSTTSDDPAARLYWAAVGAGVAGPYLDQKHNGVDQ